MKTKVLILFILFGLILSACGPDKPTFEISGSPNPLFYGCGPSVVTFTVTGPGSGLRINSIIVGYQLFDGKGTKVNEDTAYLKTIPDTPPVAYDTKRTISVPDSVSSVSAPDEPIIDFGDGRLDFAATVYVTFLSPPVTGPSETFYFTSTKSISVLPCTAVPVEVDPGQPGDITPEPWVPPTLPPTSTPGPTDTPKPRDDKGAPPCDPNQNPNGCP